MKVAATREKKAFRPIDLTLTIESEDQLNAIYSLFNYEPIRTILEPVGIMTEGVRVALEGAFGGLPRYGEAFKDLATKCK